MDTSSVIEKILSLYNKYGNDSYTLPDGTVKGTMIEEPITQVQHALQTYLAMKNMTTKKSLHLAALLHDIGHFLSHEPMMDPSQGTDDRHEELGATYLSLLGFSQNVTEPIRLHVLAKRYMASTIPGYVEKLSKGSLESFKIQGGMMNDKEMEEFRQHRFFGDSFLLRHCDDSGKDIEVTSLPEFKTVLCSLLTE